MRCTNRLRISSICIAVAVLLSGCGDKSAIENAYQPYQADFYQTGEQSQELFTDNICVIGDITFGTDEVDSQLAQAAGVFNLKTREVCYSQNLYEKIYPASTTMILTAYIILSNCSLDETTTVSDEAVRLSAEYSNCGLRAGDVISLKELLYGLLLKSGVDAAIVLAEYYSGSTEEFAKVMNSTAQKLGATCSNFVNPGGLSDEEHYTTVYDMYLIFQRALELDAFVEILTSASHEAHYHHAGTAEGTVGEEISAEWTSTNLYLAGSHDVPEGFTIQGGKTGTASAAGHCLVLSSKNSKNEPIISIVYKAQDRDSLYRLMDQILTKFGQ